jgi:hypothetical protein
MIYYYLENMNIISYITIIIIVFDILITLFYYYCYLIPQLSNNLILYVHICM